mgnify:FL=1|jgi:hypothetical protein|tara:strand:+ start:1237 stop:1482 length:246 start_codon:yes stop_codon:yes gene_type:complete
MPRPTSSPNRYYHYKVSVDAEEPQLLRTMICVANHLEIGRATVQRVLKNPDIVLKKYKGRTLKINRVKLPIYEQSERTINY